MGAFIKILGMALVIYTGFSLGNMRVKRVQQTLECLCEYQSFLAFIQTLANGKGASPDEILQEAKRQALYQKLDLNKAEHLRSYTLPEGLPQKMQKLSEVFAQIGTMPIEEMSQVLQMYKNIAEEHKKDMSRTACEARALYTKSGTIIGLLIAILLF